MNTLIKKSLLVVCGISAISSAYAEIYTTPNDTTNPPPRTIVVNEIADPYGWYVGGNLGAGNDKCNGCGQYTGSSGSKQKMVGGVEGGYRFNEYVSAEAGFTWLPSITTTNQNNNHTYAVNATQLDLRGALPLGGQLSLFGKLGTAVVGVNGGLTVPDSKTTIGLYYAGGVSYDFNRHVRASVSANYIQADTFGTQYHTFYGLGGVEYLF